MRYWLTSLLFLINIGIYAQSADNFSSQKLALGLAFSIEGSDRLLDGDESMQRLINTRNSDEIGKLSYTAGISLMIRLNDYFTLETGGQFSDKGFRTIETELIYAEPDPTYPISMYSVYSYDHLGIPLKVNFYILRKKLKVFISGGISGSFLLQQRYSYILEYPDGSIHKNHYKTNEDLVKFVLTGQLGTGLDINLNKRLFLRFEPNSTYTLNSVFTKGIDQRHYSIGINTGLFFRL